MTVWRNSVLERDDYACVRCGCGEKVLLQAHHKIRWIADPAFRTDINNGETLCIDCHAEEHPDQSGVILAHKRINQPNPASAAGG